MPSETGSRSTIDGVIAKVGPFFTWCVREGYCENNPCKAVKRPRADQDPPRIFTPQEAEKLLQAAFMTDEDLVPFLAIGLFAGIRPMEIQAPYMEGHFRPIHRGFGWQVQDPTEAAGGGSAEPFLMA